MIYKYLVYGSGKEGLLKRHITIVLRRFEEKKNKTNQRGVSRGVFLVCSMNINNQEQAKRGVKSLPLIF